MLLRNWWGNRILSGSRFPLKWIGFPALPWNYGWNICFLWVETAEHFMFEGSPRGSWGFAETLLSKYSRVILLFQDWRPRRSGHRDTTPRIEIWRATGSMKTAGRLWIVYSLGSHEKSGSMSMIRFEDVD